jgi:hypothetical protein
LGEEMLTSKQIHCHKTNKISTTINEKKMSKIFSELIKPTSTNLINNNNNYQKQ